MAKRKGRGRLSKIDLLPEECDEVVSWAAKELASRDRTQSDIYKEFEEKLIAIQSEYGIALDIPSFNSFNRYSVRLAEVTRRLESTREIASSISERMNAESSDELTMIAAETIKTLVFELMARAGEGGIDPKGAMQLAAALRSATQAQGVSTSRRQKVEEQLADKAKEAVQSVVKTGGLSDEAAKTILDKFLGVAK